MSNEDTGTMEFFKVYLEDLITINCELLRKTVAPLQVYLLVSWASHCNCCRSCWFLALLTATFVHRIATVVGLV